eukprot:14850472-Alexandrium_andersonii.AAC.1
MLQEVFGGTDETLIVSYVSAPASTPGGAGRDETRPDRTGRGRRGGGRERGLSLIHISEPTRLALI